MHGRKALHRHAAQMQRMAQTFGLNLTEMMLKGRLTGADWRAAVVRCVACPAPTECLHWLSAHKADRATGARSAPDYCVNRKMMARLCAHLTNPASPIIITGAK